MLAINIHPSEKGQLVFELSDIIQTTPMNPILGAFLQISEQKKSPQPQGIPPGMIPVPRTGPPLMVPQQ